MGANKGRKKASCARKSGRFCMKSTMYGVGLAIAVPVALLLGVVARGLWKDTLQPAATRRLAQAVVQHDISILGPMIAGGERPATCGYYHEGWFIDWVPSIHAPVVAAVEDLEDVVRMCSADLMKDDAHFHNILHQAAACKDGKCVRAVLRVAGERGAVAKLIRGRRMMGDTPLHVAAAYGNAEAVEALLDAGTDPNCINWFGVTALHNAAATNDAASVRTLLLYGADPDIIALGYTPQDLALSFGSNDAFVLLQQLRDRKGKFEGEETKDEL